ncbi:hypothetical protein CCM_08288 [Cordyceps militaris CM01]|uniref:Uncharacterized protein n=1 Tax=Cordyceps militaris (strain CM01) TaxID=983644 RepID=G3JT98_CORMM|nr:uncharacterized protein CCM_08288 [Cordyceps militaris CM01]EGX88245.1 hypothetical protein CCM_08288 [Cordyceps militaris CM01]
MYPEWPKSAADLTPLPLCPGPTLPPFDFKGWQDIEFLEYLGDGAHAHVFKVRLLGKIYALKLFRFIFDEDWPSPAEERGDLIEDAELLKPFYHYAEPFSAECRAFGRLRESGYEDLAVRCFGYLLLDEKNERAMRDKFKDMDLRFKGNGDSYTTANLRERFPGADGKIPPIRGIVKEFGLGVEDLTDSDMRRLLRDIIKFQQLGILQIDVNETQLIGGKFCDFSIAVTIPHFITSPELNPRLTPDMVALLEYETFQCSINDFYAFDRMVTNRNYLYEGQKKPISVLALPPHGVACQTRYGLRGRDSQAPVFTLVDPRRLKALFEPAKTPNTVTQSLSKKCRGHGKATVKRKIRLMAKPPRWYYFCSKREAENLSDIEAYSRFYKFGEDNIIEWEYFTLENLNTEYGPLLDNPNFRHDPPPTDHSGIVNPFAWNDDVLRPTFQFAKALQFAKPSFEHYRGVEPRHVYRAHNGAFISHPPGTDKVQASHEISLDRSPIQPLVVGIYHAGWSGRELLRGRKVSRYPVSDLARHCRDAGTRFGYIQCTTELVACCFSNIDLEDRAALIAPVPMSLHGETQLTTHLALWWLCMTAALDAVVANENDEDRIRDTETQWHTFGAGRVEGQDELDSPDSRTPPPPYSAPEPGNAAAFEASVGLPNFVWDTYPDSPDAVIFQPESTTPALNSNATAANPASDTFWGPGDADVAGFDALLASPNGTRLSGYLNNPTPEPESNTPVPNSNATAPNPDSGTVAPDSNMNQNHNTTAPNSNTFGYCATTNAYDIDWSAHCPGLSVRISGTMPNAWNLAGLGVPMANNNAAPPNFPMGDYNDASPDWNMANNNAAPHNFPMSGYNDAYPDCNMANYDWNMDNFDWNMGNYDAERFDLNKGNYDWNMGNYDAERFDLNKGNYDWNMGNYDAESSAYDVNVISYGHILESEFPQEIPDPQRFFYGVAIRREKDIKKVIHWDYTLLERALNPLKKPQDINTSYNLLHQCTNNDPGDHNLRTTHHVIRYNRHVVMAGFGRSSVKFDDENGFALARHRSPIRQLANSCMSFRLRYGYILTDKAMVVCRFRKVGLSKNKDEKLDPDQLMADIKRIPWSNKGEDELTTDLALWWLLMLALSDGQQRDIVESSKTTEVDTWEVVEEIEGGKVVQKHRHCYSHVTKDTTPPKGTKRRLLPAQQPDSRGESTQRHDFDAFAGDMGITGIAEAFSVAEVAEDSSMTDVVEDSDYNSNAVEDSFFEDAWHNYSTDSDDDVMDDNFAAHQHQLGDQI